jgi:hypothetical protein
MRGALHRYFFSSVTSDGGHRLDDARNHHAFVLQRVNFADRSDVDRFAPAGKLIEQDRDDWPIVDSAPNLANALVFESAPLDKPPEVSGLFCGRLDFMANKRDFDFAVTLFERTATGKYMQLSYVWKRASYAKDRSHRALLAPGARTQLDFAAGRLTSRRFQKGSRLVVVLSILKQPAEQIDYGSGKPVSDESVADAGPPLVIRWYADSYVDVPFRN